MSAERFTLDTNLLLYGFDKLDPRKQEIARTIVGKATQLDCLLTNQALAEFFSAAVRKRHMSPPDAQVRDWMALFADAPTTRPAIERAMMEVQAGRFSFWDALLLAAAEEAGCTICLSEDMADGATLRLVVRTPFSEEGLSPAARELLEL